MAEIKDNPIINYAAQAAQAQAGDQQAKVDIAKQLDQQEAASNAQMLARTAMGNDEATISAAKNTRQAAIDATNANIRLGFGADTTAQGSESNYWLGEMQNNAHKAYAALDAINQKRQATLLDDPLGFINAQFTLPADIATHNYYAEKHNIAEQALNEITSASNAAVIASTNAAAKTSQEEAVAESDKAVQSALYDNAKIKEGMAGNRIKGIVDINALTTQQAAMALQVHQAQNSDKSLVLQEQNHKDMMDLRKERLDAAAEGKADQEEMRQAYNAGARRMGKPTIDDLTSFRRYFATQSKNPDFMDVLGQGQEIQMNSGTSNGVSVAGSAGRAAMIYASGPTNNLKLDPVGSFLVDRLAEIKANPAAPKDRDALAAAVTDHAKTIALAQSKQIRDDSPNIYAAPPPTVILDAVGPKSDPFLDAAIRPLVTDPSVKIPDGKIFGAAFDFASQGKGKGSLNVAAEGITTYYTQAVLQNVLLKQFGEKGLPTQTNYPAVIDGVTVDATNPTEVRKAILMHNTKAAIAASGSFATMLGQ
jgi:hypothetical protein